MSSFFSWFWNKDIWLPPGTDWKDIISTDQIIYPNPSDLLYYPIPLAIGLIFARIFVERYILHPIGFQVGVEVPIKPEAPKPNDALENFYNRKKDPSNKEKVALSKQTDWEVREIERWFRQRKKGDRPSNISKFSECGWRFLCYSAGFIHGLIALWNMPWLWNVNECWNEYPHQGINNGVWWQYVFGSSFYWSLLITQQFDVKRKDFWQMFFHHLLTICLLAFSWFCNLIRIGSLVLLLHDFADIFLEFAKMAKYSRYSKTSDFLALVFVVAWITTRLGVYSKYIIYNTLFEAPKLVPMFPAYYIFNSMLIALLGLHVFWTYFIVVAVKRGIHSNKISDARSESESESSE